MHCLKPCFSLFLLVCGLSTAAHAQVFRHPGILLDQSAVDATRHALAEGDGTKTSALRQLQADPRGALDYTPTPFVEVVCGSFDKPSIGCREERRDAQAAYTHALAWVYLDDPAHARKAAEIMDAWATTLTAGHSNANAPLQASWAAQLWTRAAELLRHTRAPWPEANAVRFGHWLIAQYLPDIRRMGPCPGGNWHASGIEALMNVGIYTDDRALYEEAVAMWKQRLPSYIYASGDGEQPRPRPGCNTPLKDLWFGQTVMANGLAEESCRDLEHTAYGLAAYLNAAESDRLQGGTLYAHGGDRLASAMEFHTDMMSRPSIPGWLCGGQLVSTMKGTLELGYGYFVGQAGMQLPATGAWLVRQRPVPGDFHFLWETLTHGIALGLPGR